MHFTWAATGIQLAGGQFVYSEYWVIRGQAYAPAAPTVTPNPVPAGQDTTVAMTNLIYVESTGEGGQQAITIKIWDDDWPSGNEHLATKQITVNRPAGIFAGLLIGPFSATTTLKNVNGNLVGNAGSSAETGANVFYEIMGGKSSPAVTVGAEE